MKKKKSSDKEKGFLALAGEALSVLGGEIVEGKDKLVEAASEGITSLKKKIKKITNKQPVAQKKAAPKSAKKAVAKKAVKKSAPKKAAPKKVAKKAAPKKAAKKAVAKKKG
jgi:hypothetical protein